MRAPYTDKEIIEGIKAQDEKVLIYIYRKYRPMVINYVIKNSGTEMEAEDVLHDTIISIHNAVRKPVFGLRETFDLYFSFVSRNKWKYATRFKNRFVLTELFPETPDHTVTDMDNEYRQDQLQKIIFEKYKLLNEDCRELMKLYYFKKKRMKEIADFMNYKNDKMVIKQKHRCLEYLKVLVKGNLVYKKIKIDA